MMAMHEFVCEGCNYTVKDTCASYVHHCPLCGKGMRWDLIGIGIPAGDYEHVSDSLAIHPEQIPEHRKLFPNVEVKPDGRPVFTSPKQQEKYAERCGFYKKPQRNRNRGRRIDATK